MLAGAGVALVGAAVMASVTATRKSANDDNAMADLTSANNGSDTHLRTVFDDEFDYDFDDDCPDCAGMTIQYCPECHRVDSDA